MAIKVYKGGCLCENIRFKATGSALNPHTCSCKMCQRHTGSLTAAWVDFPKDAVQWVGYGGQPATYRSSQFLNRTFCNKCGSTIGAFVGAIDDQSVIGLLLGSFDSPELVELAPKHHSYIDSKPKWWDVVITPKEKS